MMSQAFALKVGEDAALAPVTKQAAEICPWTSFVFIVVVWQGKSQVQMISLQILTMKKEIAMELCLIVLSSQDNG